MPASKYRNATTPAAAMNPAEAALIASDGICGRFSQIRQTRASKPTMKTATTSKHANNRTAKDRARTKSERGTIAHFRAALHELQVDEARPWAAGQDQATSAGIQRCGSSSPIWLARCVGRRSSTSRRYA
jgi:hypothetical protein